MNLWTTGIQLLDHLLENTQGKTLLLFCPEYLCFLQLPLRDSTTSWTELLNLKYCPFRELKWKWHMWIKAFTITATINNNENSNYHSLRTWLFVRTVLSTSLPAFPSPHICLSVFLMYTYIRTRYIYICVYVCVCIHTVYKNHWIVINVS